MDLLKEIKKHTEYLLDSYSSENSEDKELLLKDYFKNISSLDSSKDIKPQGLIDNHINLGNGQILCKLDFGWVCVHGLNIDVAPGILRDGVIEPWNNKILKTLLKTDDTYINIGANFGYFTILAASLVGSHGKVISFEANPYVYESLCYSIFYSGFPDRIDAYNFAVGASNGETEFTFSPVLSGGGSIMRYKASDHFKYHSDLLSCRIGNDPECYKRLKNGSWNSYSVITTKVKIEPLDKIIAESYKDLQHISMIHMDVEGAESFVLSGSMQCIKEFKPTLLVEFDPSTVNNLFEEIDKSYVLNIFEYFFDNYNVLRVMTSGADQFEKLGNISELQNIPHCDLLIISDSELAKF